jgi:hypothetical protein
MISQSTLSDVSRRAHEIYDASIRQVEEPRHFGDFLVLDIESGDYEIDADNGIEAENKLRTRKPNGQFFLIRVGYQAAVEFKSPRLLRGNE